MNSRPQTLTPEQEGRVLIVRVTHPPRNLFDELVGADLADLVQQLEEDSSVGAVVITGAPESTFMTRYDTREMLRDTRAFTRPLSIPQAQAVLSLTRTLRRLPLAERLLRRTPAKGAVNLHRLNDSLRRMNRMDKAFIAAINGMAAAGGLLLPLACDIRLIADDAGPVGLPEGGLGFIPAIGGTQRTVRALGTARALELLLEGDHLTPSKAAELGLVHQVVPRDQLMPEATARAERLATRPPEVTRALKRLIYEGGSRRLAAATRLEEAALIATLSQPTTRQVVRAFTDRLNSAQEVDADQIEAYRLALAGRLGAAAARRS